MGIFKKLSSLVNPTPKADRFGYWIAVRCNRCGEVIRTRVNLANDLSLNEEDGKTTYYCRKVLIGEKGCFQRVEVELTFDDQRKLIGHEVTGGKFIEGEGGS
jgi:hypothetical protein